MHGGRGVGPGDERLARRIAELVEWCAVGGVGGVLLTQAVGWDGTRLVSTVQSLTPYGLPVVIVVAALAAWQRSRVLAATAAVVGLGILLLSVSLVFPAGRPAPIADAVGLRVASINLLYSNPRISDVADELTALDPDVVLFIEFTAEHRSALLDDRIAAQYPYRIDRHGADAGGMALWSRFPITDNGRIDTESRTIDASLDGPDGPFRLLGVHPPTPISSHGGWTRSLHQIGALVDASTDPTLVVGDFNATYWHPAFRDLLRHGLTDAHIASGRGFSTSWPTDEAVPAFVRLDHALTAHGLVSTDVVDFRPPGSDHAAFVVTVSPAQT